MAANVQSDTAPPLLTRGQWRRIAGWTAIVTFVSFVGGFYFLSFGFDLFFWFVFWLAFFHWVLCGWLGITETQVRLIDYPYLVAAATGIFLLAVESQAPRDEILRQYDDFRAPPTKLGLQAHVADRIQQYCVSTIPEIVPRKYCQWMMGLREFLASDFSAEDLRHRIADSQKLADSEEWGRYLTWTYTRVCIPPRRTQPGSNRPIYYPPESEKVFAANSEQCASGFSARLTIHSMEKVLDSMSVKAVPVQKETPTPSAWSIFINLFHQILWPFALALALALRLTKVTADVTGWARRG